MNCSGVHTEFSGTPLTVASIWTGTSGLGQEEARLSLLMGESGTGSCLIGIGYRRDESKAVRPKQSKMTGVIMSRKSTADDPRVLAFAEAAERFCRVIERRSRVQNASSFTNAAEQFPSFCSTLPRCTK